MSSHASTLFFEESYLKKKNLFDSYLLSNWKKLRTALSEVPQTGFGQKAILDSVEYSLLGEGKRFRPVVALAIGEAVELPLDQILPWALAIEMIHTYSLIHDDLPCMDDDSLRRGRPTNHKVFGEATALLAGDALLTEAFAEVVKCSPALCAPLIRLLVEGAGLRGMLMGQCLDLAFAKQGETDHRFLSKVHELKTAKLIEISARGAALISQTTESLAADYGFHLGMSFQIADDLLDKDQNEKQNYVTLLGECSTQDLLERHVDLCLKSAQKFPNPNFLCHLAEYNLNRKI